MLQDVYEHLRWLDEMVVPTLASYLPTSERKDYQINVETDKTPHHHTYRIFLEKISAGVKTMRQIKVYILDKDNVVSIEYNAYTNFDGLPQTLYKSGTSTHGMDDMRDIERVARYFADYAIERAVKEPVPSRELVEQVQDINTRWIGERGYVQPYLDSWDFGDDWRLRLFDNRNTEVAKHITPTEATGHLIGLMLSIQKRAFEAGRVEGAIQAFERLTHRDLKDIVQYLHIAHDEVPQRARHLLNSTQLR